jgi:hypothetical protein
MNRRQFTQRLAAIAATPILPASITSVTMATPAAASAGQPYLWAALVARIHDKASVQMFKRQLSLTDETATQVYNTLLNDGVISAPNAQGVSHAMNPFKRNFATSIGSTPQSSFKQKIQEGLDHVLDDDQSEPQIKEHDDSVPVNPDSPECHDESDVLENPAQCSAQHST